MRQRLLISTLVLGLVALAVAGWTVRGLRWTLSAPARRGARLLTAG